MCTIPTTIADTSTTTVTTTTLPAGCTQLDSIVNGVAGVYKGSLIRTVVNVSTLARCAAECQEEHMCLYFAIHVARGCQLLKTKGDFQPSGAFTAGMGVCTIPTTIADTSTTTVTLPPGCTRLASVVDGATGIYKSTFIATLSEVASFVGCAAACHARPECIYFTLSTTKGCQLRKTKGAFTPFASVSFAVPMGECTAGSGRPTWNPDDATCLASITFGASPHSAQNPKLNVVGEVPHGAAPDTRWWSPVQCARYCAAVSTCEHWIVNRQGCILMRRHFKPAAGGRPESLVGATTASGDKHCGCTPAPVIPFLLDVHKFVSSSVCAPGCRTNALAARLRTS